MSAPLATLESTQSKANKDMPYPTRKIGNTEVAAIGWGAMGISTFYGSVQTDEERLKVLDRAYELGVTNWDSADAYADSEVLIGKWFSLNTTKRADIFLATKFGFTSDTNGRLTRVIRGDPAYVKEAVARSLERLGVESIDLYYAHRVDPKVPIEDTVATMAELVKAGKIKQIGLSEPNPSSLRRAHAIHPIAAIQVEYSPFTLDTEGVVAVARELGVAVVAYSPLGRGLLTGKYRSLADFEPEDVRRYFPRFSQENFPKVLKLADDLKKIGERHNATAGQVCLAWLLAQGGDVIPIPGTKKIKYLEENARGVEVKLSQDEIDAVRAAAIASGAMDAPRYGDEMMKLLGVDSPMPQV